MRANTDELADQILDIIERHIRMDPDDEGDPGEAAQQIIEDIIAPRATAGGKGAHIDSNVEAHYWVKIQHAYGSHTEGPHSENSARLAADRYCTSQLQTVAVERVTRVITTITEEVTL